MKIISRGKIPEEQKKFVARVQNAKQWSNSPAWAPQNKRGLEMNTSTLTKDQIEYCERRWGDT